MVICKPAGRDGLKVSNNSKLTSRKLEPNTCTLNILVTFLPAHPTSVRMMNMDTRTNGPFWSMVGIFSSKVLKIVFFSLLVKYFRVLFCSISFEGHINFMIFNSVFRHGKLGTLSWNKTPSKFLLGKKKIRIWKLTKNSGTGVRAGVHMKLEKLSVHPEFDNLLGKLRLQKRGTGKSPKISILRKSLNLSKKSIYRKNWYKTIFRWCRHSLRRWYVRYFQCWSSWFLWTFIGPNGCWWC